MKLVLGACVLSLAGCTQIFSLTDPVRGDAAARDGDDVDGVMADVAADGSPPAPTELLGLIRTLGSDGGLILVLDAGAMASYDGLDQRWQNRVAVGGKGNFRLGLSGGTSTDDPTFHGIAGGLSDQEYFSFDGGDFFVEDNGGWGDDAFHRSDAKLTIVGVEWAAAGGVMYPLFSNCRCNDPMSSTQGVLFVRDQTLGKLAWYQEGDTNTGVQTTMSAAWPLDSWHFVAFSADASGGKSQLQFRLDMAAETVTDVVENYSANNTADRSAAIGTQPTVATYAPAGSRVAMLAMWNRVLSPTEIGSLYTAVRNQRFPTLP